MLAVVYLSEKSWHLIQTIQKTKTVGGWREKAHVELKKKSTMEDIMEDILRYYYSNLLLVLKTL